MAIRCNGANQNVNRATNLPVITAYTAAGFAFINAVNAGVFNLLADYVDTLTASGWFSIGYNTSGSFYITTQATAAGGIFAVQPPLNQWIFWAMTQSGTSCVGYWGKITDTVINTSPTITGNSVVSFDTPRIALGSDGFDGSEPSNCSIAWVKYWNRALSATEIAAEKTRGRPVNQSGINSWSPLTSSKDVRDYSGNGFNFTANAGVVGSDGPPLGLGDFAGF